MSAKRGAGERFSLSRWSRRKLETTPGPSAPSAPAAPEPALAPAAPAPASAAPIAPAMSVAVELPPVESLSFDSDFTAFLRPDVDDKIKRAALKQLFRDPRFNVMDGLDTYIDDYTKADPIPPDMLAGLLRRFAGNAPDAGPAPAVAAAERGAVPAPAPTHLSPSNGEEDARAERSAGQGEVSTPATGDERAPAEGDVGEGAAPPAAPGESR